MSHDKDFIKALEVGRPPNVAKLFPNSKALIVSGKVIDRAMIAKGNAISIAANVRNSFVIRGALMAAQRANSAIILEIAKSEGGAKAYCAVNLWNMATMIDAVCNELGITVPVAVHADHYGIQNDKDLAAAKIEIPTMFDAGITSIAIDASHLPDDKNLLASIELNPLVPKWAGLETEVGEIKGKEGLSTPEEALFLIQGLNAHGIFPDWIALNNGTTHGIEESDAGIQVDLTAQHPQGDREVQGLRRAARHLGQQLGPAPPDSAEDQHHQGQRGDRAPDDLLGPRGERLRQRHHGREQELQEGQRAPASPRRCGRRW